MRNQKNTNFMNEEAANKGSRLKQKPQSLKVKIIDSYVMQWQHELVSMSPLFVWTYV